LDPSPTKEVAVKAPVELLKAKLLPDLGGKSPVAPVTNRGKQVVSEDSSATVTFVEVVAVAELPVQDPDEPEVFPVTFPVNAPTKDVAVNAPLLELKAKFDPLFGANDPVAAVTNNGKQVVSELSSATVTVVAFPSDPAELFV
tara:strand:+ start:203 stop:631 length:429 start_codon:yes stop_codon:yes gene_type:complete